MEFRVIYLPPFTAASSGPDPDFNFSPEGILGKFNTWFSTVAPSNRDSFMPRDFLFYNREAGGLEWWYALAEGMDDGGFSHTEFEGGYYVTYTYRDGDEEATPRLWQEAVKFIEESPVLELDERPGRYGMGHIITPPEIIAAQGYAQMESFVPVRLKA